MSFCELGETDTFEKKDALLEIIIVARLSLYSLPCRPPGVTALLLVCGPLWWLAQLHVVLQQHQPAQLLEDRLDGVLSAPSAKDGDCTDINLGKI